MRKPVVLLMVVALTSLSGLVGLKAAFRVFGNPLDPFDDARFTSAKWLTTSGVSRAPMARDLVRNYLKPGMTNAQLLAMLGSPEITRTGVESGHGVVGGRNKAVIATTYEYRLDETSIHYGYDASFLYVHLDASGTVVAGEVYGY